MKTLSCERIGINDQLFIKGVTKLNNGMELIQIATFYDSNVFRTTAYIQSGSNQSINSKSVNQIYFLLFNLNLLNKYSTIRPNFVIIS